MKNVFQQSLTFIALFTLALSSCQKEDAFAPGTEAVKFTSSISSTRASGTNWSANDSIGIYMFKNGTSELMNSVANFPYITPAGNGVFQAKDSAKIVYYPVQNQSVDFTAYYPYKQGLSNQQYPLDVTDQSTQSARAKTDFMLARLNAVQKSLRANNLTFTHELSKIRLNISAGGNLTANDLKGLSVSVSGTKLKGTFDMTPGVSTPIDFGSEQNGTLSAPVNADGTLSEFILIPQTSSSLTFSFTLTVGTNTYKAQASSITLEKGKQYTYNVLLMPTEVMLTANGITDWTSGNGSGQNMVASRCGYAVGDLYPDAAAPVGVVFYLDTTNITYKTATKTGLKGKIVSLTESSNIEWGSINTMTRAYDWDYGLNNQNLIKSYDSDFSEFPAFYWCANHTAGGRIWYLPALGELAAMNRALTVVNEGLAKVSGATTISLSNYWSSREDAMFQYAWTMLMGTGQQTTMKFSTYKARAISEFSN